MFNLKFEDRFDVIDLDPYGSMVPFLYAALKSLKHKGMLCVTCTDTRVLCGADKHKCYYLYGSARGGNDMMEETGLRIALHTISNVAGQLGKTIKVLLSVQSDFYVRLFIQVIDRKREAWRSMCDNGIQFYCDNCCYQHYHAFGSVKDTHKYQINRFAMPDSRCNLCDREYSVSKLIRWTHMDRSALRRWICTKYAWRAGSCWVARPTPYHD